MSRLVVSSAATPLRTELSRPNFHAETIALPPDKHELAWSGASAYLALHDVVVEEGQLQFDGQIQQMSRDIRRRVTFAPTGLSSVGWCAPVQRNNQLTIICFDQKHVLDELEAPALANDLTPLIHVRDPGIEAMLAKLARVIADPDIVEDVLVDALLLLACAEATKLGRAKHVQTKGALSDRQLGRVADLIEARLASQISLQDMAAAAGLSAFHFSRAFKRAIGVSPYRYLLERRIERAKEMIREGRPTMEVIAATGFSGPSQFSRTFSSIAGETPRAFRKRS
ncbi:MAG: helix-turn-helix domain-containing protein [Hyphomonadaceae bacterium]